MTCSRARSIRWYGVVAAASLAAGCMHDLEFLDDVRIVDARADVRVGTDVVPPRDVVAVDMPVVVDVTSQPSSCAAPIDLEPYRGAGITRYLGNNSDAPDTASMFTDCPETNARAIEVFAYHMQSASRLVVSTANAGTGRTLDTILRVGTTCEIVTGESTGGGFGGGPYCNDDRGGDVRASVATPDPFPAGSIVYIVVGGDADVAMRRGPYELTIEERDPPCGTLNSTVRCSVSGDYCPTNTTCDAAGGTCTCPAGYQTRLCDGTPCTGAACPPHGWQCSVCVPDCTGHSCGPDGCGGSCGSCGRNQTCGDDGQCRASVCGDAFAVPCSDGGACPWNSTCAASHSCACNAGYEARDCAGQLCNGSCVGPNYECVCARNCAGRSCGPDSCGGTCGPGCATGQVCTTAGTCCTPNCSGRRCGSDGCGGSCGSCPSGTACNSSGQCACAPNCGSHNCGGDGCGGSCGTCGPLDDCVSGNCRRVRCYNFGAGPCSRDVDCCDPNTCCPSGPYAGRCQCAGV